MTDPIDYVPCIAPEGPAPCDIMIVGEAPGRTELAWGRPFVGASGIELDKMLEEASIDRAKCYVTNVFLAHPEDNLIDHFFVGAKAGSLIRPPMGKGKYLHPQLVPELHRLFCEIRACQPKIIIALGNTAFWALCGKSGITKFRGVFASLANAGPGDEPLPPALVLPTFHPSAILRAYANRPIAVADLIKAREAAEGSRETREIVVHINPTMAQLESWPDILHDAEYLACDVETKWQQIRTYGFAPDPYTAYVVPIFDRHGNYWATARQEGRAMEITRAILHGPSKKIFHNGSYDIQYTWRCWGIAPRNIVDDTMIMHHALMAEMQKALGFLASLYTDNMAWKEYRHDETNKRDE